MTRTVQRSRTAANADTSLEPQGLTRRVMLNILEAFFRRPWLHLIPLILMVALGVSSVINLSKEYTSTRVDPGDRGLGDHRRHRLGQPHELRVRVAGVGDGSGDQRAAAR